VLQAFHARHQGIVIAHAFGHLVRHLMVGGEQRRGFAHAGSHRLKDRQRGIERRFLRHVTDADTGLHPDLAIIEPAAPRTGSQGRQQGRFAGTVTADQGDPFARIEQEIGVIEQRHVAIGKAGIGKFEIRHEA